LEATKRTSNSRMLTVDNQEFQRVRKLKYLGSTLTDNNITCETKEIIVMKLKSKTVSV
jgi:hypothetical protein